MENKTLVQIVNHFVIDPTENFIGEYFKQLSDIQLMIMSEEGQEKLGNEGIGRMRREVLEIFVKRLSYLLYDLEEYYNQQRDKNLTEKV